MPDDPLDLPEFLDRKGRVTAAEPEPEPEPEPEDDDWLDGDEEAELPEGLTYHEVYYVDGEVPKNLRDRWPNFYVKDPPCSGHSRAWVLRGKDARRVTILCPNTLQAYTVKADAGEIRDPQPVTKSLLRRVIRNMRKAWDNLQALGMQRDYDVAAAVLKRLGEDVPAQLVKGGEEDRRERGGKEPADELLKPVKRKGKRGKFLAWFLEASGPRSVRECMAEFGMSRSNALSYLYMLHKDHGLGYVLVGDDAEVRLPPGCESPFDDDGPHGRPVGGKQPVGGGPAERRGEEGGDDWLD